MPRNWSDDFYSRQMEFVDKWNEIAEIETDKVLLWIINDYLKKEESEWVSNSIVNFINQRWNKNTVIEYITYILNNNPNNLENDDLFQLANLKNELVKNEISQIRSSVEQNWNIDFEIVWWTITVKTISVKHEWWLKFSKEKSREIEYDIVNEKITDLWNNRYNILLKAEGSRKEFEFNIKYSWWHSVTIYDKDWRYIWRQIIETKEKTIIKSNWYRKEVYQTPWRLTIDTKDENIRLKIMFKN